MVHNVTEEERSGILCDESEDVKSRQFGNISINPEDRGYVYTGRC